MPRTPRPICWPTNLGGRTTLHCDLGLQVLDVPEDGCDSESATVLLEAQETVFGSDVALDRELVPFLGMADIVDRDVVVLAPEEGDGGKFLAVPEHIEHRG